MKQQLFFLIFLFVTVAVSAQFKTPPGQIDSPGVKAPHYYLSAKKQNNQFLSQHYINSLKIYPDRAPKVNRINQNAGNALLTATVGAALTVASVYGGGKGCNIRKDNMGNGGLSLMSASGYYLEQALKQHTTSTADKIENQPSNQ